MVTNPLINNHFFNFTEVLKWQKGKQQRRKPQRRNQQRRNQQRRKSKNVIIEDYHKAIDAYASMAFFFNC